MSPEYIEVVRLSQPERCRMPAAAGFEGATPRANPRASRRAEYSRPRREDRAHPRKQPTQCRQTPRHKRRTRTAGRTILTRIFWPAGAANSSDPGTRNCRFRRC
ncbi:protein of unassigned function [Methylobacterium oryzae CBMB20]|uniref:Protein of unassigned function n=1 Tax=Methylobacterium oryzae CBMB20 TaxID=693986 RepID=A0A089NS87_9HYPH|nr:protein of unassigned function [Methylobacterium oryzae CBMB20]